MSAVEDAAPAVAAPSPKAKAAPKAKKTKEPKAKKTKEPKAKAASHPIYSVMVIKAIAELKEKTGSSKAAILKYVLAHYKVGDNINKVNANLRLTLKRGVAKGDLKQVKGTGASGSFKLEGKVTSIPAEAKSAKKAVKKTEAAPAEKKAKSPKKAVAKKPKAKISKKPASPMKAKSPKKAAAAKPKAKKAAAPKKATATMKATASKAIKA